MATEHFDVVVVGAGPAGSAAAFSLAALGVRILIIDKSVFPRDKLCGGLVTPRSKKIFESVFARSWNNSLFNSSDLVEFHAFDQLLATISGYCTLYFTMRLNFDAYLINLAQEVGAYSRLGSRVTTINVNGRALILDNNDQVSFDFLIGADGVNSQVAKTLYGRSFDPKTIGFGLEIEVPRNEFPSLTNAVEIDFHAANWGYGWVFPKTDFITAFWRF